MDVSDFLNSLRDLIVLLPVVILILGPMLVRMIRRRQRGAAGAPPAGRQPDSGKRAAGETAPATLRKQSPFGLMRRHAPRTGEQRRAPVALRVTREQVFRRAEEAEAWPRVAETPAESPGAALTPSMAKMQSSLDQRAQLRESVIDELEKPRVRYGRSRLDTLSPLKRAILWAEILGKPKGW